MKLIHSIAFVAAFLLISETFVSSDAATLDWGTSWFSGGNKDTKDNKTKDPLAPKAEALQQKPPTKDEEGGAPVDSSSPLDEEDYNESSKIAIEDDGIGEDIKTINTLPEPSQTDFRQTQPQTRPAPQQSNVEYDRNPQQSPFVDNALHPTVSQGPDPRFAQRNQCQDGQYLCRKATPQQEHIRCIPNEWKCNGVRDCEENDDEEGCAINNYQPRVVSQCSPSQYTCYGSGVNGLPAQCIDKSKVCNGHYECTYGDDEDNDRCTEYAHRRPPTDVPQPQPQPPVQNAPPVYQPQPAQPQPQPRQPEPQPPQQCPETRSDEQFKRLEWTDRCIRSCLNNNRH